MAPYKTILTTIVLVSSFLHKVAFSQNLVDSLWSLVETASSDSSKLSAYRELTTYLSQNMLDSCLIVSDQMMEFAEEIGDEAGIAKALSQKGMAYYKKNLLDSALQYWSRSAGILVQYDKMEDAATLWENMAVQYVFRGEYEKAKSLLDSARNVHTELQNDFAHYINLNYGLLYDIKGDYDTAYTYYHKAFLYAQEQDDRYRMGLANNNICVMYYYMGDCIQSLQYGQNAVRYYKDAGRKFDVSATLKNMALCYEKLGNLDSAILLNKEALELDNELGNLWAQAQIHHNLGALYAADNQREKAEISLLKAYELKRSFPPREGSSTTPVELAVFYSKQNRTNESLHYLEEGLALSKDVGILEEQKTALEQATEIYKKLGRLDQALQMQSEYIVIKDSLLNIETIERIEEIKERYESEKKTLEIENLSMENALQYSKLRSQRYWLALITMIGLSLGALVYIFRRNYMTAKRDKMITLSINAHLSDEMDKLKASPEFILEKYWTVNDPKQGICRKKFRDIVAIISNNKKMKNSIRFITLDFDSDLVTRMTLTELDQSPHWPKELFIRIHASSIINLYQIDSFDPTVDIVRMKNGKAYSVSGTYRHDLLEKYHSL